MSVKRFKDVFSEELRELKGKRVDFGNLVGKEIVVTDFVPRTGEYGEFYIVQFKYLNKKDLFTTSTGAKLLMRYLKSAKEKDCIPLQVRVMKVTGKDKSYYMFG